MNATTKPPVFCPDCRNPNTFDRDPDKDIMSVDQVGWEAWKCRECGYKTIKPTPAVKEREVEIPTSWDYDTRDRLMEKLELRPGEVALSSRDIAVVVPIDAVDKRLENGSFFCKACCEDREAGRRSPDPRYCQDCYDFLTEEAKLLNGTRRPKWVPKPKKSWCAITRSAME